MKISQLCHGDHAVIVQIQDNIKSKLGKMGIREGSSVRLLRKNADAGVLIETEGSVFYMRKNVADAISVKR